MESKTQNKSRFMLKKAHAIFSTALIFIAALSSASALAASGQFTYVTGDVFVESQGRRTPATRGTEVNPGDVVVTGANGLAQLTMIDQAKLSLRVNSQLRIERYQRVAGENDGAILALLRGTLRTFTGLLSVRNRDQYQMRTRVATVGIRGSGNIMTHTDDNIPTTINHTIEGSHAVNNIEGNFQPIITSPNDTVRVQLGKPPELIPTPLELLAAVTGLDGSETNDAEANQQPLFPRINIVGGNGLGYTFVDTKIGVAPDPIPLQDVGIASGGATFSNQAVISDLTLDTRNLRGYRAYAGEQSGAVVTLNGGTIADAGSVSLGAGNIITWGRWNSADGVTVSGQALQSPGSVHWIYANAGYPAYLSDVLTGTASYQRVGATTPTNQLGTLGSLVTTILDVNFTARTLNATIGVSLPAAGNNSGGSWTLRATNLTFAFNSFSATTGSGLAVTNGNGQSSATNANLTGSLDGSFVGSRLNGAIVSYGINDRTATNAATASVNVINGVVAFQGPSQNSSTPYRDGLISDPAGSLVNASFIQSFATTNRPNEVTTDSQGRVIAFAGPALSGNNVVGHQPYALGTATISDAGFDATTGLTWGRWSGGSATIGGQNVALTNASLHTIFSANQSAPVTLPLTGTAVYDVIGSTKPTDLRGNVGNLNSATLNANFSARTVNASVNVTVANQTWNASASNVPIYRNQYFSAYAGGGVPGLPRPAELLISCTPNCTPANATGSLDGFFTGRTGQGAGVLYNINNIAGTLAFRRRQ
jgi:FecR protein